MADPISRDDIKARLENVEACLRRQEGELASWRDRSVRVPNWIRNGGIALFMALFAQAMAAVWWAAQIEGTQLNIAGDVKVNTEYRISSTEKYNDIMIELTKIQVMLENHFNEQE
jgi:hypothetical protein